MTPVHAILIVIIRLWAAGTIIGMIAGAPLSIIAVLSETRPTDADSVLYFVNWLVWLIAGVVGWFAAPWLSRRVYSARSDVGLNIKVSAETLVAIGSFLIGAFYLVQYGPRLAVELISIFLEFRREFASNEYRPLGPVTVQVDWTNITHSAAASIVAAVMALRPAYLARIFNWLRNAGQYEDQEGKEK